MIKIINTALMMTIIFTSIAVHPNQTLIDTLATLNHASIKEMILNDIGGFYAYAQKLGWSKEKIQSTLQSILAQTQQEVAPLEEHMTDFEGMLTTAYHQSIQQQPQQPFPHQVAVTNNQLTSLQPFSPHVQLVDPNDIFAKLQEQEIINLQAEMAYFRAKKFFGYSFTAMSVLIALVLSAKMLT